MVRRSSTTTRMLGVCLDTCHAFAAGHDLAAPGGMKRTLDALVKTVGRGRLGLVHANDSKDPLGSGRDRHEAIGAGPHRQGPVRRAVPPPGDPRRARRRRDPRRRGRPPPRRRAALRAPGTARTVLLLVAQRCSRQGSAPLW